MFYKIQENSTSEQNKIVVNQIDKIASLMSKKDIRQKRNVIYALLDPNTFEIRYVGYSGNIRKRLYYHLQSFSLNKENTHKNNWIKSLLKIDQKPIVVIVEEYQTYNELPSAEINYIAYCKSIGCDLTNGTIGGDGVIGHEYTEEQRKANSEAHKKYRFTQEEIDKMTNLYKDGMGYENIAKEIRKGGRHLIRDLIQENDPTIISKTRDKYRKIPKNIQQKIIDLHNSGSSINEIRKIHEYSANAIKKCLEDHIDELTIELKKTPRLNFNEMDLFRIVLLRYLGVKINRIAELFECDRGSITTFLRKRAPNLPPDILGYKQPKGYKLKPKKIKIKKSRFTDEQILEMIELHRTKISFTKIAIKFKSTKKLIKETIIANDKNFKPNRKISKPFNFTQDDINNMKRLLASGKSTGEVAKEFNCGITTVVRYTK